MTGLSSMEQWFSTGRSIDVIIALVAIEMLGCLLLKQKMQYGSYVKEFVTTLLSGLCLLFALRGALVSASWIYIASGLLVSFCFHIVSLRMFWIRSSKYPLFNRHTSQFNNLPQTAQIKE